jgi:hypothetical protein
MRTYLAVGIGAGVNTAALEATAALLEIQYKLSEPGPDGLCWLSVHGQIGEDDLHQVIARIQTQ